MDNDYPSDEELLTLHKSMCSKELYDTLEFIRFDINLYTSTVTKNSNINLRT